MNFNIVWNMVNIFMKSREETERNDLQLKLKTMWTEGTYYWSRSLMKTLESYKDEIISTAIA